jgi:hypothetical protein
MIDGVQIRMGGREFLVPPLNLKTIRRLEPKLANLSTVNPSDPSNLDDVVEIVHAALSRNYPDLGRDEIEDLLDMGNLNEVIVAIMGISGLKKKSTIDPGSPSDGGTSTGTSPPAPAGDGATSTS